MNEVARRISADLGTWSPDQVLVLKEQCAPEATDVELAFFLNVAKSRGLDPFARQIYAIHRYVKGKKRMTIQTGIDGYRLLAERSGAYAGNDEPVFTHKQGSPYPSTATVTVWRLVGGQRYAFSATARWAEYCPVNKKGEVPTMWRAKPYLMLSKCAEALALRKAFPGDLSGIYTDVEMEQAGLVIDVEATPLKSGRRSRQQEEDDQQHHSSMESAVRAQDKQAEAELAVATRIASEWIKALEGEAKERAKLAVAKFLEQPTAAQRLKSLQAWNRAVGKRMSEKRAAEEAAEEEDRLEREAITAEAEQC